MTERELLIDCLRRLNASDASYMLTGSMASNYWGVPRTTHDIDFVIQLPSSAISKFAAAFRSDFYIDEASIRAASSPPFCFTAIDSRSSMKADFWTLRRDAYEETAFSRRKKVEIFGEPAYVPTPEDAVLSKLRWNQKSPSKKQLSDASGIVMVQKNKLDNTYLKSWAQKLGVSQTLDEVLSGAVNPHET